MLTIRLSQEKYDAMVFFISLVWTMGLKHSNPAELIMDDLQWQLENQIMTFKPLTSHGYIILRNGEPIIYNDDNTVIVSFNPHDITFFHSKRTAQVNADFLNDNAYGIIYTIQEVLFIMS